MRIHDAGPTALGVGQRTNATYALRLTPNRAFAKDVEIFAEGEEARYFFRVTSGAVRTYKTLADGRRQIYAFHLPGDVFGLECGFEHRFTAEAVGDVAVTAYRRCSLAALTKQEPDFGRMVIESMMQALDRAQTHIVLLGRKCAVEKVASFLVAFAARLSRTGDVELPMSRLDIADHLGLTIETVSRCLTQLERDGVICLPASRRNIQLKNHGMLARLDA